MKRVAVLVTVVTLLSIASFAQRPDTKSGEVYGGFTHLTGDIGKNGWNISAAYNFTRWVSAEADFAGYYGFSTPTEYRCQRCVLEFIGRNPACFSPGTDQEVGPRRKARIFRLECDLWAEHESMDVVRCFEPEYLFGNWHLTESVAARGKADLIRTSFFDDGDTHLRWGVGLVYNFR